ncbi:MAG: two-component regulator propeller domain-containing protein [Bacteroidota bacterium]
MAILTFHSVNAQDYIANARHIGLSEGITHQHAKCFFQDRNGLMWIGTFYGLNRFDGHHFDNWTQLNDGLSSSDIDYLMEDKAGWIWAVTAGKPFWEKAVSKISLVHSVTGEVEVFENKFGQTAPFQLNEIDHFFSSPDRSLFFVSQNGFWKYLPDTGFTALKCPAGVRPLNSFDNQTFWGMHETAMVHFDAKGEVLRKIPYSNSDKQEWLQGDEDDLWLREFNTKLVHLSNQGIQVTYAQMDFVNGAQKPWCFDPKRRWVWVSNQTNLLAFDKQGNKVFDLAENHHSPIKANITSIYVDSYGLLWLGTRYGFHLLEIKPNRFRQYLSVKSNNTSEVGEFPCRGLLEVGNNLFVNTYTETFKVDLAKDIVTKLDRPKPFENASFPYSFLLAPDGTVWSGSNHLSRMDGKTGRIIEDIKVPGMGYKMWALHQDQNGVLWLNKGHGIYNYQDGTLSAFRAYNGFSALENSTVYFYYETQGGVLWLGTDSGLYKLDLDEGVTDRFWLGGKGDYQLPADQIQFIHEDAAGFFWLATENEGLVKWHPETKETHRLTRANGLPTNTIYAIYEDEKGFLWMSSYFGLIQMDKHTLRKKIYMPEDGISYPEFNRTSHFKATEGRIYFGGQNGLTAFYPRDFWEVWQQEDLPPLQVYQFTEGHEFGSKKINASLHLKNGATLNYAHDVRTLTFKLKTPDFFLSDKIDYYYRVRSEGDIPMSPFSGEWVRSNGNTINLLGIVPGKYHLAIEARGLDGERACLPLEYEINMAQPFSHTLLFRIMAILAVLGSFVAFYRLRARNMKKRQRLLEMMVEERTQQIFKDQQLIKEQEARIQQLDSMLNNPDKQWLEEVDELIRQNLTSFNLNIADIAYQMNISRTHFFRKLKSVTGMTPNQYLQEARLQAAKLLLESGKHDTVKAVSLSVGFKKSSYFSSLFKERFGVSPSNYFHQN